MNRMSTPRRALTGGLAATLLAGTAATVVTQPAQAGLYNPIPATEGGPEWSFSTADALYAFTTSDFDGGDICVVADAPLSDVDKENNCKEKLAWGSKNYVVGLGTQHTPVQAPPLRPGTWRLMTAKTLADGGGNARLSEPFTVSRCLSENGCDPRIGEAAAKAWKAAAAKQRDAARTIMTAADGLSYVLAAYSGYQLARKVGGWGYAVSIGTTAASNYGPGFVETIGTYGGAGVSIITFSNPFEGLATSKLKSLGQNLHTMYSDIVADPPDPNFGAVEKPVNSTFPEFDDPVQEKAIVSLDRQRALGRSVRVAYERYQGALEAGNSSGQVRQAKAVVEYSDALAQEIDVSADALEAYSQQLDADPAFNEPMFKSEEERAKAEGMRTRVREEGFSSVEQQRLVNLGFDEPAELDAARASLSASVADAEVGITIPQMLDEAAKEMREQKDAMRDFGTAASLAAEQEVVEEPENIAPTASFSSTTLDAAKPRRVAFDASTSSDQDGSIISYEWDFGDGTTGAGVTPTHEYVNSGTYTVNLKVTDNGGLTAATSATVNVMRSAPQASMVVQVDPDSPLKLSLDGRGSNADGGSIEAYGWDFGDGQTGTVATVEHTYATAGTYTVKLTVTDDAGATAEAWSQFTLVKNDPPNQPPTVSFSIAGTPVVPAALTFDASGSSDPDGSIVAYDWDFGDGSEGVGASVEHTYTKSGTYTAALTATDDEGATNTTEVPLVINDPQTQAASCGGREATIVGTGEGGILGTKKDDVIVGTAAAEKIYGGAGDDVICAGSGDDQVRAEKGNDTVYGGDGADVLDGGLGKDDLTGQAGDDELLGGDARDVLFGGDGNDELRGGAKRDSLYGEADDDALYGEEDDDLLHGGPGLDRLDGGPGRNILHQD